MSRNLKIIIGVALVFVIFSAANVFFFSGNGNINERAAKFQTENQYPPLTAENTLYINVKSGIIKIQMLPDVAPLHVERIKTLAKRGFYDGILFHRVIDGFMAQTGDPVGNGSGGSDLPNLKAEFTEKYRYERSVVGMARTPDPNGANSQFFIMFAPANSLNGQYTIWGRVVDGMNAVDGIAKGEPPASPDKMLKVYFEE